MFLALCACVYMSEGVCLTPRILKKRSALFGIYYFTVKYNVFLKNPN